MAANTAPIFTLTPDIQWGSVDDNSSATAGPILSANTAMDGTGYVTTVFTAGANGSYVSQLIARPVGTNIATVLRVFINNGSTNATQANNCLLTEVTLAASTASLVAALLGISVPLNFALPSGYKINCTLGTAVAAGYRVMVQGGDYLCPLRICTGCRIARTHSRCSTASARRSPGRSRVALAWSS